MFRNRCKMCKLIESVQPGNFRLLLVQWWETVETSIQNPSISIHSH